MQVGAFLVGLGSYYAHSHRRHRRRRRLSPLYSVSIPRSSFLLFHPLPTSLHSSPFPHPPFPLLLLPPPFLPFSSYFLLSLLSLFLPLFLILSLSSSSLNPPPPLPPAPHAGKRTACASCWTLPVGVETLRSWSR